MTDPITKLKRRVRQLERARDGWRSRCAAKQDHIRYLRVKARDLALSRERWRSRAHGHSAPQTPDAPPPVLLPLPAPREGPPSGGA
jgi:hypothetical protein